MEICQKSHDDSSTVNHMSLSEIWEAQRAIQEAEITKLQHELEGQLAKSGYAEALHNLEMEEMKQNMMMLNAQKEAMAGKLEAITSQFVILKAWTEMHKSNTSGELKTSTNGSTEGSYSGRRDEADDEIVAGHNMELSLLETLFMEKEKRLAAAESELKTLKEQILVMNEIPQEEASINVHKEKDALALEVKELQKHVKAVKSEAEKDKIVALKKMNEGHLQEMNCLEEEYAARLGRKEEQLAVARTDIEKLREKVHFLESTLSEGSEKVVGTVELPLPLEKNGVDGKSLHSPEKIARDKEEGEVERRRGLEEKLEQLRAEKGTLRQLCEELDVKFRQLAQSKDKQTAEVGQGSESLKFFFLRMDALEEERDRLLERCDWLEAQLKERVSPVDIASEDQKASEKLSPLIQLGSQPLVQMKSLRGLKQNRKVNRDCKVKNGLREGRGRVMEVVESTETAKMAQRLNVSGSLFLDEKVEEEVEERMRGTDGNRVGRGRKRGLTPLLVKETRATVERKKRVKSVANNSQRVVVREKSNENQENKAEEGNHIIPNGVTETVGMTSEDGQDDCKIITVADQVNTDGKASSPPSLKLNQSTETDPVATCDPLVAKTSGSIGVPSAGSRTVAKKNHAMNPRVQKKHDRHKSTSELSSKSAGSTSPGSSKPSFVGFFKQAFRVPKLKDGQLSKTSK